MVAVKRFPPPWVDRGFGVRASYMAGSWIDQVNAAARRAGHCLIYVIAGCWRLLVAGKALHIETRCRAAIHESNPHAARIARSATFSNYGCLRSRGLWLRKG